MHAFGISTPFALDRGQLVLNELSRHYKRKVHARRPRRLNRSDLKLVHTERYLRSLDDPKVWVDIFGLHGMPPRLHATRALPELLHDFTFKSGGTLLAARLALKYGVAANLGAGYHHAAADFGGGFCAINDIAIAIRWLQKNKLIKTAVVIDVDYHQGNGTASIFEGDESVVTLSIFSQEAWPPKKARSTFDVPIKHNESGKYLERFKSAVIAAFEKQKPDICLFVQGSDAYEMDAMTSGRFMKLTLEQLKERDEFVIDSCVHRKVPIAMVFAGGYGPESWRVHYNAVSRLLQHAWK